MTRAELGYWAFIQRQLTRLRRFGPYEIILLVVALVVLLFTFLFIRLMDEVREGDTQGFDEWVLRSLRRSDDPTIPIGPSWLRGFGLDVTALGSPVVLMLVVAAVVGFMLLQRRYRVMWLTVLTTTGGAVLSCLLKFVIERERPTIVPHLQEVTMPSFPSGHAMLSAVVYLTLGMQLRKIAPGVLTKLYCVLWAMLLTFLVGSSRIYLGVHYPTDVIAGWMAALVWGLACWLIAQYFPSREIFESRGKPGSQDEG
jgi:undecaprenyl-diphosphatase